MAEREFTQVKLRGELRRSPTKGVPALNILTAAFHPAAVESSVLVLNALLGLGTALAPVFVAIFVGLGFWWGLPLLSAILLSLLVVATLGLPLRTGAPAPARGAAARRGIPRRFWMYAGFAVLYGVCETVNGNWSQLDMTSELGASTTGAAIALTAFWAMVTVGRVTFAAVDRWLAVRTTFHVLPFLLGATFVLIALLPDGATAAGVVAFGLAGLCCSALLPLTIGFGAKGLSAIAAAVAGGVIAFYQLGYGIAAFGRPAPRQRRAAAHDLRLQRSYRRHHGIRVVRGHPCRARRSGYFGDTCVRSTS